MFAKEYIPIPELTEKQIKRFWDQVHKGAPGECWPWTGSADKDGYGTVGFNYKTYRSHRVSMKLSTGQQPDGHGMHSCDNPPCCNPSHLSPGTDKQNQAFRKGNPRFSGENHGNSRVSNADAANILIEWNAGARGKDLAAKYGVSGAAISSIIHGKNHKTSTGVSAPVKRNSEHHHRSKLNWEKVRQVRARHVAGESNASLAKEFGVSGALISLIVTLKIWIE